MKQNRRYGKHKQKLRKQNQIFHRRQHRPCRLIQKPEFRHLQLCRHAVQPPRPHRPEQVLQNGQTIRRGRCSEEHQSYKKQCKISQSPQLSSKACPDGIFHSFGASLLLLPATLLPLPQEISGNHKHSGEQAPDQIIPAKAMPEAGQHKDREHIEAGTERPPPAAAKRNIHIFCKKARQRHMPALPEFRERLCLKRRIEVQRKMDVQHP